MPDMRISQLEAISTITGDELFVAEQNGQTKNMKAEDFNTWLSDLYQANGYITSITGPVSSENVDTYTIHFSGTAETVSFDVTNGTGITSIDVAYGIASQVDPTYVQAWYTSVVAPTDANPYAFTRFTITDSLGNSTVAYTITSKASNPTFRVGTVTATEGETAGAAVQNTGTLYNPELDFSFVLPRGAKGDTGDYIMPTVAYGETTSSSSQPGSGDWVGDPSMLSYASGNFIWKRTQYVLHDEQTTPISEKIEIIGYIGRNGTGSGTVTQIVFNGETYAPPEGSGTVTMNIDASDVGAIADPANKANGQVLTYDGSSDSWRAANPASGGVTSVNGVGATAGTTNIQLDATEIPMSSSDNTPVASAIPQASSSTPADLGTASPGSGTTWARADHVHAMPSAADVGAASSDDVKYKIYNSITDLGLTEGSATMAGVLAAMPNRSILITYVDGVFASGQLPGAYGTVEIVKTSSNRGSCIFHNSVNTGYDFRISINSSTDWTTWSRIQHGNFADKLKYINPTFTVGTINAADNSQKTFTLTADSGYTILGVIGYQIGGKQWGYVHPTRLLCNRGTGNQTLYVTLSNTGTKQATEITIKVVVLEALTY